jgi:hypothetical protein
MEKHPVKILFFFALFLVLGVVNMEAQQGQVIVNQDRQIDALLKIKEEMNRTESNFKIQIYNGNRSDAEKARSEFIEAFDDLPTSMHYETPNYKIWIGSFKTRLEADRALVRVKEKFSSAFIFTPKIEKKGL